MRILIYRPDNIGDFILFSGALRHLREYYAEAAITLAVQPQVRSLVAECPYIDRCLSLDDLDRKGRSLNINSENGLLGRALARGRSFMNNHFPLFDLVIYPVKSPQVLHLRQLQQLKLKNIVGIVGSQTNCPDDGYPDMLKPQKLFNKSLDVSAEDPWRHELLTTLDFLKFLRCPVSDIDDVLPVLWPLQSDAEGFAEYEKDQFVLGLFPFTSEGFRNWDIENYHRLSSHVDGAATYVLFGAEKNVEEGARLEELLSAGNQESRVVNMIGKTSLADVCSLVKKCDLVLGMETSGLHIAVAQGIPTVGIVGGGHWGRFVPWGQPAKHIFLTNKVDCFHCNWRCVRERVDCIQGVAPEEVTKAILQLLNRTQDSLN